MAVWNFFTMLKFRAISSFCRTPVLYQKDGDKLSKVLLKLSKPKRPASSFLRFALKYSDEVREKNPKMRYSEIMKAAGNAWLSLPKEEKARYQMQYSVELEDYKSLMEDYLKKVEEAGINDVQNIHKMPRQAEQKLLGKPARPPGPFFLFAASVRKSSPDVPLTASQAKIMWDSSDESVKKKFEEQSKEANEKYQKELFEWEKKMFREGNIELIRGITLEKLKKTVIEDG